MLAPDHRSGRDSIKGEMMSGELITTKMKVTLRGYGNPDFKQYADVAPKRVVSVDTLEQAARICLDYISYYDLGGGNWGTQSGVVFGPDNKPVARISYNGRCWYPGPYPQPEIKLKGN